MAQLLAEAAVRGMMPDYIGKLLAAFQGVTHDEGHTPQLAPSVLRPSSLVEPLSQRELEILKLITQGLSNREIGERLFLALDTVKGHNRRIFDKLQVQSRTEAIARFPRAGLVVQCGPYSSTLSSIIIRNPRLGAWRKPHRHSAQDAPLRLNSRSRPRAGLVVTAGVRIPSTILSYLPSNQNNTSHQHQSVYTTNTVCAGISTCASSKRLSR